MKLKQLHIILILITMMTLSCFDPSKPNYQYFPNMYESVGYKTYQESDAFQNGIEAEDEHKAEMIVEKKVKELMYGGPYYAITEDED